MSRLSDQFSTDSNTFFNLSVEDRFKQDTKIPSRINSLKKSVLFIPAPIRSHIIPSLYLADLVADEYDVFYAVTSPLLAEIVAKNGFIPVLTTTVRIGERMELYYPTPERGWQGFIRCMHRIYTNELYEIRKKELDELLSLVMPAIIIIDVFNSNDFLPLYSHRDNVRLLFYNPMLSTYRVDNFPIVSESEWPKGTLLVKKPEKLNLQKLTKNPRVELYKIAFRQQLKKLPLIANLLKEHSINDTSLTRHFGNVTELILAPLELELSPSIKKAHQYYLGLCVREKRTDTELDPEFDKEWRMLLEKQKAGERIVYCSFGTYYTGSDKALLNFIARLLDAISTLTEIQLICSVNNIVIETFKSSYASLANVHFFQRVPQLVVLENTDVYITHGGLGSIKESIHFGVPMLVYPLDSNSDQPGNGLKIEYHRFGLRGNFAWESAADMKEKLVSLLNNTMFKANLIKCRQLCDVQYTEKRMKDIIHKVVNHDACETK